MCSRPRHHQPHPLRPSKWVHDVAHTPAITLSLQIDMIHLMRSKKIDADLQAESRDSDVSMLASTDDITSQLTSPVPTMKLVKKHRPRRDTSDTVNTLDEELPTPSEPAFLGAELAIGGWHSRNVSESQSHRTPEITEVKDEVDVDFPEGTQPSSSPMREAPVLVAVEPEASSKADEIVQPITQSVSSPDSLATKLESAIQNPEHRLRSVTMEPKSRRGSVLPPPSDVSSSVQRVVSADLSEPPRRPSRVISSRIADLIAKHGLINHRSCCFHALKSSDYEQRLKLLHHWVTTPN